MSLTQAAEEGGILVGHGLLLPSALLLEKKLPIDEGRLLDFGTLMNALVLHDKLVTLPATIPDHIKESKLYSYLEERNLILTLDKISFDDIQLNEIKEMLEKFKMTPPSEEEAYTVLSDLRTAPYKYTEKWKPEKLEDKKEMTEMAAKRTRLIKGIIESPPSDLLAMDDRNYLLDSREKGMRIHTLRTIFYWKISDIFEIPFVPDFLRIPIIAGCNLRLFQSIRQSFETTVDNMNIKMKHKSMQKLPVIRIPIPGLTVKFLKMYNKKREIHETIDSLREEFRHEGKFVVDVEKKIREANDDELRKLEKQIEARKASLTSEIRQELEEILITAGGTTEQAFEGGVPVEKVGKLAMMLAKTFKNKYYRGSSMSYYVDNVKEAQTIRNQDDLLRDTFGSQLTVDQKRRYLQLATRVSELFKPST